MEVKKAIDINHQFPEGKTQDDYPYSMSAKIFDTDQLFLYSERLTPGKKSSAPHFHRERDEVIFVSKGEVYAVEGTQELLLIQGDSVCFYANSGLPHYLENRSEEEAEFLIFRVSKTINDVIY